MTALWIRLLIAGAFLVFGRIYYGDVGAIVPPVIFLAIDFVGEKLAKRRNDLRIFFLCRFAAIFVALFAPVVVSLAWDAFSFWQCERSPNCDVVPVTVVK